MTVIIISRHKSVKNINSMKNITSQCKCKFQTTPISPYDNVFFSSSENRFRVKVASNLTVDLSADWVEDQQVHDAIMNG